MSDPAQLRLPSRPLVLAIAGCSGSGKTTLAVELASQLEATLFPLDFYYRDLAHLPREARAKCNFDHPDSLESELIVEHVRALADGLPIDRPIYDFATHCRVPGQSTRIEPRPVVIVEGILALYYQELLPLYDVSVFVEAPDEVCLKRRIYRDVRERGRTEESVREQFFATAQPMAEKYVQPSAATANLRVEGTAALDWSIEQVLYYLHRQKLLPH